MIEPVSAATLGGLALDTAQAAITKWVGARIALGFSTARHERPLKQGLPAKDQQTELAAIITTAVDLTATELFPDQDRLQGRFHKTLLTGEPTDWPLVGGSDLDDLVGDVHTWITANDPQPGASPGVNDLAAHPYLAILCRNITTQFGFRAENNGAKNTILYPRWNRFWTTELFNHLQHDRPDAGKDPGFHTTVQGPVHNLIQAGHLTINGETASRPPAGPRRFGTVPPIAAAHQDRPVDQELSDSLAGSVDSARRAFFISYTSADEGWAEWIAHVLEEAGYSVVIQAWDFRPGSNFVIEMQKALQSSDRMIAVLSPDYLAARFPKPEWAAVFAADPEGATRRLIPVMVRHCRPDGLLGQIVQIRIHDLDRATAAQKLLNGVSTDRARPNTPPVFPGSVGPTPGATGAAPSALAGRLTWRRLPSPPEVRWRNELDNRLPNQGGHEAVELHLVPVGDEARLQVRELTGLKAALPDHGRRHGHFSATEALDALGDSTKTTVLSQERGKVAGLAVTRSGQRSVWIGLPRDMLGAVLDESYLTDQLVDLLDTLTSLPLPTAELVVPAIGIEPATMVAIGSVTQMPRSSAQIGHGMPQNVRPVAEDAVTMAAVRAHGNDVAIELAARLITEHQAKTRAW